MTATLLKLSNGLRVVFDPIEKVESLTLGAWINVGSRHEPEHLSGLAHLLEHMVFKGTRARTSFEIVSQIEGQGGAINAYTGRETTAYYCRLLKEDLALGVEVLADLIKNAELKPEELEKERLVILQEIHQAADTPDDIIFDHFQETAFPDQGLGRPVLGQESVLKSVQSEPLKNFRDATYGADTMTLVLSGNFEEQQAQDLVEQWFGDFPTGSRLAYEPGRYVGGRYVEVRKDLEQVHLLLGWPGAAMEGPGYYAQMLIATLLGGSMSSRLFQEVREKRGLAYSVSAFLSSFQDSGLFSAYAGTDPDQLNELLPLMAATIAGLADDLEEPELARAKQLLKASLLMGQESTLARAESFAGQIQVFGKLLSNEQLLEPLEAVELGQVKAALRDLIHGKMTVAMIGPKDNLPAIEEIESLFQGAIKP